MQYIISTKIIDIDAKGTTGCGTVFQLDVEYGSKIIETHVYGLLDLLNGSFNKQPIVQKYHDINAEMLASQTMQQVAAKTKADSDRVASVQSDPLIQSTISSVIKANESMVDQYRNGKEKVINSLVGKIIGDLKSRGVEADAFVVMTLLKQSL